MTGALQLAIPLLCGAVLSAQPVRVESGSGSGEYATGAVVHVWADPPAPDAVFDRWTGDIGLLEEPFGIHTRFTMPERPVTLRARYRSATPWNPVTETLPGSNLQMIHYVPPQPRGLILRFHGGGGSAANVFRSAESQAFNNDAVAAGFGVLALDSSDRTQRQWNPAATAENPDIRNVQQAVELLRQRRLISAATPLFANGASNGGGFVSRVTLFVNLRAASYYIASGIGPLIARTVTPAIWCLMANDKALRADGNAEGRSNFEALRGRGIPAQFYLQPPQPVHARRFTRIPGLSPADGDAIFAALKGAGLLDENNYLRDDPGNGAWRALIPVTLRAFLNDITAQLDVCYANHEFFADANHRVLEFFSATLGEAAVVHAASFASQALAPDSMASVFAPLVSAVPASTTTAAWPLELAGAAAALRDAGGLVRLAPLAFVGPHQANLLIPAGTPAGPMLLTVGRAAAFFSVAPVAPGLFTLEGTGRGTPAALLLRVSGGVRTETVVERAIDFGPAGDELYLSLFGTGWRGAPAVQVRIGGLELAPLYAGPQGTVPGLDQVNVALPRSLAGRGVVAVTVTAGGLASNAARLTFR